jgi:hypothetical protein
MAVPGLSVVAFDPGIDPAIRRGTGADGDGRVKPAMTI